MLHKHHVVALALFAMCASITVAKDQPLALDWPQKGDPVLRFSITKFRELSSYSGQNTYLVDTTIQNLSTKRISSALFDFYLFDKNKVRIGQGYIEIRNLAPSELIKVQLNCVTTGTPASMSVTANRLPPELEANAPPKIVSLTVYSVPSGATLKVDGKASGTTPVALSLAVGSHTLEFAKEGYNTGTFPLVITRDQLSGGTVSYELGTSAHDTIELRDGTVLTGDLQAITATNVEVRVGGSVQTFDRNKVKRVSLIERDPPK